MKLKHIFIATCTVVYLLIAFSVYYFKIDLKIGCSIILGLFGVLIELYWIFTFILWLAKNWNRDINLWKNQKMKTTEENIKTEFDSVSISECWDYYDETGDIQPLERATVAMKVGLQQVIDILKQSGSDNTFIINKIKRFI